MLPVQAGEQGDGKSSEHREWRVCGKQDQLEGEAEGHHPAQVWRSCSRQGAVAEGSVGGTFFQADGQAVEEENGCHEEERRGLPRERLEDEDTSREYRSDGSFFGEPAAGEPLVEGSVEEAGGEEPCALLELPGLKCTKGEVDIK